MIDLEGLWKFSFYMPRIGQIKAVMELENESDGLTGTLYFNDKFDGELTDIVVNNDFFIADTKINKDWIKLNLKFLDDAFSGTIIYCGMEFAVRGFRSDFSRSASAELTQAVLNANEKELLQRAEIPVKPRSDEEIRSSVESLLQQMTIEEKIGQMYQMPASGNLTGPEADLADPVSMIRKGSVGSVLGFPSAVHFYSYQKIAVEQSRLKIPLMLMADVIHGLRTIFPIPLAQASSWDMNVIERCNRIAAIESTVSGIHVTFAPMVDIARDPRWGRIMEGAGEDPYLGAQCAAAAVRGFQGPTQEDLARPDTLIATVKHYAAYGAPDGGRDYNTVDMSDSKLRNFYLPPYKGAVDAGVACLMSSFNVIHGEPSTGNQYILKEILRNEWGFKGMTISDYNSVIEMIAHGVCKDTKEAAKRAIQAGLDIEMVSMAYLECLKSLVQSGEISESLIDEAVKRILYFKFKIGLFDDPYRYLKPKKAAELILCQSHRDTARDAAKRTFVLLKNAERKEFRGPVLPLTEEKLGTLKKIALIGPFGDEHNINGAWSALGNARDTISVRQGISNYFEQLKHQGKNVPELVVEKGCHEVQSIDNRIEEAYRIASDPEVGLIILALGEPEHYSGEAKSRGFLNIPGLQEPLAKRIRELGKPTVLILFGGRPLILTWFDKNMDAILNVWFPGTEGGSAISDVLFGLYNPSGKLTVSYPVCEGQIPIYYNHLTTGRPQLNPNEKTAFISDYLDIPNTPLYPFGYGLSYTKFRYSSLASSKTEFQMNEEIEIRCDVANIGPIEGEEVVQLYIQDVVSTLARPCKELKGFQKINLKPNESKPVIFKINPKDLGYWNNQKEYVVEPGEFVIYVGSSSIHTESIRITLK